jgi:hypothetical protein
LGRREEIGGDDLHKHTENFQEERWERGKGYLKSRKDVKFFQKGYYLF